MAFAVVCSMIAVLVPLFAYGQTPDMSLALQLNPPFPQPTAPYTATLIGNSMRAGSIRWFVNGDEIVASKNQNSVQLVAPSVTNTATVVAKITYPDGTTAQTYQTVTPYRVDLIVQPNTQTSRL